MTSVMRSAAPLMWSMAVTSFLPMAVERLVAMPTAVSVDTDATTTSTGKKRLTEESALLLTRFPATMPFTEPRTRVDRLMTSMVGRYSLSLRPVRSPRCR